jgi:hypothetical protein
MHSQAARPFCFPAGNYTMMTREEALKLLRGGEAAIAEWNRRRDAGDAIPDLSSANLSGADLSGADLSGAGLSGANLSGANLTNANLRDAELSAANLSGADLSAANLTSSNFTEANLTGANLTRARLNLTVFSMVDLSTVQGLDTAPHFGPSEIGIHTLYKSEGKIPDVFLRGCGIPEEFIAYKSSFVGSAIEFYSCFISYSHEDKSFAKRLHDGLQGRGIRCWLDEHAVQEGEDIYEAVDRGIRLWDKVLLCASKSSLTSWWVDAEINKAFKKEQQLMKQKGKKLWSLIPLNLDGQLFSDDWQRGWKDQVLSRKATDFTNWKKNHDKFEQNLEKLVQALRTDDGGREPPPVPKLGR